MGVVGPGAENRQEELQQTWFYLYNRISVVVDPWRGNVVSKPVQRISDTDS